MGSDTKFLSDDEYWLSRLLKTHNSRFLFLIAVQFFNEGLVPMKIFAMKDLFKTVYMVEPSSLQKYTSLSMFPWVLKILYGIVIDQKIVSKRSYYILVCGIIASVMNFIVAKGICDHA